MDRLPSRPAWLAWDLLLPLAVCCAECGQDQHLVCVGPLAAGWFLLLGPRDRRGPIPMTASAESFDEPPPRAYSPETRAAIFMAPTRGGGSCWTSLCRAIIASCSRFVARGTPYHCCRRRVCSGSSFFCRCADGTDRWCFFRARVFFRFAPGCVLSADRLKEGTFHSTVPTIGFNAVRWPPLLSQCAILSAVCWGPGYCFLGLVGRPLGGHGVGSR